MPGTWIYYIQEFAYLSDDFQSRLTSSCFVIGLNYDVSKSYYTVSQTKVPYSTGNSGNRRSFSLENPKANSLDISLIKYSLPSLLGSKMEYYANVNLAKEK